MTDLGYLRRLAARAKPTPWIRRWGSLDVHWMGGNDALRTQEDIDYAVAAVNALPDLIARMRELEAALRGQVEASDLALKARDDFGGECPIDLFSALEPLRYATDKARPILGAIREVPAPDDRPTVPPSDRAWMEGYLAGKRDYQPGGFYAYRPDDVLGAEARGALERATTGLKDAEDAISGARSDLAAAIAARYRTGEAA